MNSISPKMLAIMGRHQIYRIYQINSPLNFRVVAIIFTLSSFSIQSFAQATFQSAATGNWNAAGTDADGIPDTNNNVTIVSGYMVSWNFNNFKYRLTR